MRYAIWTAVSTKRQAAQDKMSMELQENECRALGKSKGWIESAGPFRVPGASRSFYVNLTDAERDIPQIADMLNAAENDRFDVLVFYSYDRLGDVADMIAQTLRFYGVQLFSVSQGAEVQPREDFDPYGSDAESNMRVMAKMTQHFRIADLRRKYRGGMAKRVELGIPPIRIPYGYARPAGRELDRKAIPVQVPAEARVIVEIKEMFLRGTSYLEIRDHLNKRGAPAPGGANEWNHPTIKKILLNPFYSGKVFFGRRKVVRDVRQQKVTLKPNPSPIVADGRHQPLYSWDDHLAILAEAKRREGFPRNNRYQFSGLLVCSICGARLVHDHGVWRCKQKGQPIKDHIGMSVEEALALVPRALQKALYDVSPEAPTRTAAPAAPDALGALERQRRRVQQAYESEIYTAAEAENKIKVIDAQMRELKDEDTQRLRKQKDRERYLLTVDQARELLDILPQWVAGQEPKRVNHFLLRLCRSITVTPDGQVTVQLRE